MVNMGSFGEKSSFGFTSGLVFDETLIKFYHMLLILLNMYPYLLSNRYRVSYIRCIPFQCRIQRVVVSFIFLWIQHLYILREKQLRCNGQF